MERLSDSEVCCHPAVEIECSEELVFIGASKQQIGLPVEEA